MADRFGARAGERQMLTAFLDWYRVVVEHKLEGLSFVDASRQLTGTGCAPSPERERTAVPVATNERQRRSP